MKKNSSTKVKTGIFVIAGLAVLLLMIFLIGNQKNLFRSTFKLHVHYRTVVGLQEGSFVRFAGINVGVVELIDIKDDTTVRVDISIQKKVNPFIKTDSRASISTDGLMGDKLIQILPGSNNAPVIAENGELIAVNPFDMEKIMARVERLGGRIENIVGNIDTLSGNLSGIFSKVNNGGGTLGKLLNSEKLSNDLEQTIVSAKKTVRTADKAAQGLNENMEAAKHNFLLKGFFKKKERKRIRDSVEKAKMLLQKEKEKSESQD
jgi:phospholipid/cholesterol/gamma-HCH transport system substrate-binding protein